VTVPEPPTAWTGFDLPPGATLPLACPACLAPGRREVLVPGGSERGPRLVAHYCESCGAELDRATTRSLALLFAASALGVFVASACAFAFGARHLPWQLASSAAAAACLPGALLLSRKWPDAPHALERDGAGQHYLAARRSYARLSAVQLAVDRPPPEPRRKLHFTLPLLLALGWALVIQYAARVDVWIVQSEQDLTLLIDDAVVGSVPASLEETPEAGRREVVLGGRRRLTLIDARGALRAETSASLFPGRSYLFGQTPAGRCFFVEQRGYGRASKKTSGSSSFTSLEGPGPLWELPVPIDFWFVPPPPPGPAFTSGGIQTALRLLPCPRSRRLQAPSGKTR